MNIRTVALSRRSRVARALMGAMLASGAALLFILPPGEIPIWSCLFHDLTGYSCFTCGLTRSLHAAADGHLLASFQFHLLGPILFGGMLLGSVAWTVEAVTGRALRLEGPRRVGRTFFFSLAAIWAIYGLFRLVLEIAG
ncbi:MAG: DUF2752 domain-containing protein [Bacteroidota bacterium]